MPIEKINATGFNDYDLSKLVLLYNGDQDSQVPSRSFGKEPEPTFVLGVKGGTYSSTLKYTKGRYAGYTFNDHSGSLFGMYALIRLSNKLIIQPELYYVSKGGVYSAPLETFGQQKIDFDYLLESGQIALNLRYNFTTRRLSPYVLGGFCVAATTNSRTHRRITYETYGETLRQIVLVSEIGYRGAVGISYKLSSAWQLSMEGLWEKTRVHTKEDDFYSNGMGLLASVAYSLSVK